jgi:hypothetical protein
MKGLSVKNLLFMNIELIDCCLIIAPVSLVRRTLQSIMVVPKRDRQTKYLLACSPL